LEWVQLIGNRLVLSCLSIHQLVFMYRQCGGGGCSSNHLQS